MVFFRITLASSNFTFRFRVFFTKRLFFTSLLRLTDTSKSDGAHVRDSLLSSYFNLVLHLKIIKIAGKLNLVLRLSKRQACFGALENTNQAYPIEPKKKSRPYFFSLWDCVPEKITL